MGEDNIFSGTGFTRNQIIRGYYKRNEICSWQGNPIEIGSLPISVLNKYSHAQQAEFLQHLSENFPDQEEFPVLDEEGRIVYVIEKQEEQTHINWEKISFPEELKKYKKIYLSSLGSDNLLGFFQRFRKDVEMQVLSEDNLDDALRDGVILYELDGLPECSKVNLLEAVKRNEKMLQEKARQVEEEARRKKEEAERPRREAEAKKREKEIKKILPLVHITNKWAAIKENELQDMSQLIEKFDEGYHTVSIIDSEYNFKCLVDLRIFKEDFPKKDFRIIDDLWVEWNDNEEELKRKIAEMVFADLERKEIPILHNGKIVSLGRFTDYFDMDGNWDSRQVYAFDWDWINEDVAREFFLNRRKLLISSRHGFLKGFIEKFSSWLDITVYEDCLLEECIADHFDLILCGSGYFNSFSAEKWNAHELFIMLLLETVRRWLAKQGVSFHFFSYDPDIPNIESRLSNENELIGGTKGYLREGASPYFIVDGSEYDRVQECNKKMPNYHSGIRYGVESQMRGNRICFFGACVVIGFATYSPYKTIESFLQNIVNADVKPYQVINYGTEGVMLNSNYFNWLYRLMDTPFTCGDIVVVFGRYYSFWGRDNRFAPYNRHLMSSPFLEPGNIDKKCFRDPFIAHMDTTGYEIMSRYVKKSIENDFATRVYKKDGICFMKDKVILSPYSRLGAYIERFPKAMNGKERFGAIILRSDIITKGHIYLIQEASTKCDKVYVFYMCDDDKSFGFLNRKTLLETYSRENINFISYSIYNRNSYEWSFYRDRFISRGLMREFDPVDDTYTFARYIAPRMGITKYFVGEEPFDKIARAYNTIRREILTEEGVEYIEIPRLKLEDGRDIITEQVRELWKSEGWRACRDYLPEEICRILEEEENNNE